ncbi:MAG: hypothetical protein E6R03_08025 [Hyphomicrobiaceae bacterium]|jgi:hypothetical protein|nr:MAG: hypothetical protein E6R03_08025 [Hyphomicrobiaceae bacterium]
MPIVSSTYTVGHAQANGSRYVRELHTWDDGSVSDIEYGPIMTEGKDLQAIADARAAQLEERAAAQEFEELIGGA